MRLGDLAEVPSKQFHGSTPVDESTDAYSAVRINPLGA